PRGIICQAATPFGHKAMIAKDKSFNFARDFLFQLLDFRNSENAWQHDAFDPEFLAIKFDRLDGGRSGLNGKMEALIGVMSGNVTSHADIGDDDSVNADHDGFCYGRFPKLRLSSRGKGVECEQDFGALFMGI